MTSEEPSWTLGAPDLSGELAQLERRLQVLAGLLDAASRLDEINHTIQLAGDRGVPLSVSQQEPFRYSPNKPKPSSTCP